MEVWDVCDFVDWLVPIKAIIPAFKMLEVAIYVLYNFSEKKNILIHSS